MPGIRSTSSRSVTLRTGALPSRSSRVGPPARANSSARCGGSERCVIPDAAGERGASRPGRAGPRARPAPGEQRRYDEMERRPEDDAHRPAGRRSALPPADAGCEPVRPVHDAAWRAGRPGGEEHERGRVPLDGPVARHRPRGGRGGGRGRGRARSSTSTGASARGLRQGDAASRGKRRGAADDGGSTPRPAVDHERLDARGPAPGRRASPGSARDRAPRATTPARSAPSSHAMPSASWRTPNATRAPRAKPGPGVRARARPDPLGERPVALEDVLRPAPLERRVVGPAGCVDRVKQASSAVTEPARRGHRRPGTARRPPAGARRPAAGRTGASAANSRRSCSRAIGAPRQKCGPAPNQRWRSSRGIGLAEPQPLGSPS